MNKTEKLLHEWVSLKEVEDTAKKQRQKISDQLEEIYEIDQASKTFKEGNFKIEIKKSDKVEVDQDDAETICNSVGKAAPFRVKYELDKKKYDALKDINESFYKRCSEAVTFKLGSVSVSVKVDEQNNNYPKGQENA